MRQPESSADNAGARANILLVDDQPANLLALEAVLASLGQNLVRANSGDDALRHLLADDFAVVLLDLNMPGLDGFATARLIRGRERSRHTPIIFLTAGDGADFPLVRAYELGAVDYLVKPLVPEILRAKVAVFVELAQKTERLRQMERAEGERRLAEERQRWELARAQEEADRQRRRAEELAEADRRKDEFLALLGHELRNPLAPIRNAVAVLRRAGGLAPSARSESAAEQARGVIERQVAHMARLVDDLLDISRITTGKIVLRKQPVELGSAIEHALETCRPLLEARGHHLAVELPPGLWLEADPARLKQVIVNLLTNAAKYTEPGGRVGLRAVPQGDSVVLRVWDSGVGIPPDMLDRIFEKFTQVDRSPSSASQWGLGVGLSLVKALVELHGGSVTAASAGPGQGSTFTVHLPGLVAPPRLTQPCHQAARQGEAGSPVGRPLRVLLVDDNADGAFVLAELLRHSGHEVRTAANGPAALEAARCWRPQAVVLDIGLPGMDGYEVARRLRLLEGMAGALLVALTGYGRDEDRRHALEAGFNAHLVKPADPDELRQMLAGACRSPE
jgi:signal transduction histidine kinase